VIEPRPAGSREELCLRSFRLPVVLALPRGGVVVGYEIAKALAAPLEICSVRKIGAPSNPELAIGALAYGEIPYALLDHARITELGIDEVAVTSRIKGERRELARREQLYREGHPPVPVAGRTVILVDDGIATGWSIRAALRSLSGRGAHRVVLAVPVAERALCRSLESDTDEVVSLLEPAEVRAVSDFYDDFAPVDDAHVMRLLRRMRHDATPWPMLPAPPASHAAAHLTLPSAASRRLRLATVPRRSRALPRGPRFSAGKSP
jgi:predicted phosphoribosyltransferase